eukprot:scaffold1542_cov402-Prasinococcus_capsulatus_cf.AAC.9
MEQATVEPPASESAQGSHVPVHAPRLSPGKAKRGKLGTGQGPLQRGKAGLRPGLLLASGVAVIAHGATRRRVGREKRALLQELEKTSEERSAFATRVAEAEAQREDLQALLQRREGEIVQCRESDEQLRRQVDGLTEALVRAQEMLEVQSEETQAARNQLVQMSQQNQEHVELIKTQAEELRSARAENMALSARCQKAELRYLSTVASLASPSSVVSQSSVARETPFSPGATESPQDGTTPPQDRATTHGEDDNQNPPQKATEPRREGPRSILEKLEEAAELDDASSNTAVASQQQAPPQEDEGEPSGSVRPKDDDCHRRDEGVGQCTASEPELAQAPETPAESCDNSVTSSQVTFQTLPTLAIRRTGAQIERGQQCQLLLQLLDDTGKAMEVGYVTNTPRPHGPTNTHAGSAVGMPLAAYLTWSCLSQWQQDMSSSGSEAGTGAETPQETLMSDLIWASLAAHLERLRELLAGHPSGHGSDALASIWTDACYWLSFAHAMYSLILHSIGRLSLQKEGHIHEQGTISPNGTTLTTTMISSTTTTTSVLNVTASPLYVNHEAVNSTQVSPPSERPDSCEAKGTTRGAMAPDMSYPRSPGSLHCSEWLDTWSQDGPRGSFKASSGCRQMKQLSLQLKGLVDELYVLVRNSMDSEATAILEAWAGSSLMIPSAETVEATDASPLTSSSLLTVLIRRIDDLHSACHKTQVPEQIVHALVAQCLEHINAQIVSSTLIQERCTQRFGEHLRQGLREVAAWFEDNSAEEGHTSHGRPDGVWLREEWTSKLANTRQVDACACRAVL